jgi:hypothetical protein
MFRNLLQDAFYICYFVWTQHMPKTKRIPTNKEVFIALYIRYINEYIAVWRSTICEYTRLSQNIFSTYRFTTNNSTQSKYDSLKKLHDVFEKPLQIKSFGIVLNNTVNTFKRFISRSFSARF